MATETLQEFKDRMKGLPIEATVKELIKMRKKHESVKEANAALWHKIEHLSMGVLPGMMDDLGTTGMKFDKMGYRMNVKTQPTCKTLDKEKLMAWLRENGHEDIITQAQDTVNSARLKGFLGNQVKDGEPIPDEKIIDFGTYELVTLTKL